MRITESQLRKVIREVIEETAHLNDRGVSREDMHKYGDFDKDGNYTGSDPNFMKMPSDDGDMPDPHLDPEGYRDYLQRNGLL